MSDPQKLNLNALDDLPCLSDSVEASLQRYFNQLEGHTPCDVYPLVIAEVEAPLLRVVMAYANDNQSVAAQVLGLNRGTLRKKLKQYNIL
jgi:Fis family transcriptional regulator